MYIVFLLLVHILISILISFLFLSKENKEEFIVNFSICIFIPIIGYGFCFMYFFYRERAIKKVEEDDFEEEILLFTDKLNNKNHKNIASLEEVLLINSNEIKRKAIIDHLKDNTFTYINMLKLALLDEDVETSHYASVAISEIKRKLELKIQQYTVLYENDKNDIELLQDYAQVLKEYLDSGIIDSYSKTKYMNIYFNIAEKIIEQNIFKLNKENSMLEKNNQNFNVQNSREKDLDSLKQIYMDIIDKYFETKNISKVHFYINEFISNFNCEEAYERKLKYYYTLKDKEGFDNTLNSLRKSKIILSKEGIDMVRFWI